MFKHMIMNESLEKLEVLLKFGIPCRKNIKLRVLLEFKFSEFLFINGFHYFWYVKLYDS